MARWVKERLPGGDKWAWTEGNNWLFLLPGISSTSGITVGNKINGVVVVTLSKASIGTSRVYFEIYDHTTTYNLALADDVPQTQTTPASWSGTTYKSTIISAGYTLSSDKKSVNYTAASSGDTFTLSGVKSTTGITVDETNKVVTLTEDNLNSANVTFSANDGDYTFALSNVTEPTTDATEAGFDGFSYKTGGYRHQAIYFLTTKKKSTT